MRQAEGDAHQCVSAYSYTAQAVQHNVTNHLRIAGWEREAANVGAQPVETSEQSLNGLC